jgi:hypothetical protein
MIKVNSREQKYTGRTVITIYLIYIEHFIVTLIGRNCNMLPLSLDDLLNYTKLMLKFFTNKPTWASLLRQVFFWGGGGRGRFAPKKGCNAPSAGYGFPRKKNPPQAQYVL